jgi:hypothetical protein
MALPMNPKDAFGAATLAGKASKASFYRGQSPSTGTEVLASLSF